MDRSFIQSGALDVASKKSFPVDLVAIMRRQAEYLLLGNSRDQKGRDALKFIISLANDRSDLEQIKKGQIPITSQFYKHLLFLSTFLRNYPFSYCS